MKKVIAYLDGFNLYYGMLKGSPYKWLDLEKFVGKADAFMLVSGDSDLAGPVAAIRYQVKRPVAVYNPHEGACDELKRYASFYKTIPRDLPARCQLPDRIPVGTHGNFISRPLAWR